MQLSQDASSVLAGNTSRKGSLRKRCRRTACMQLQASNHSYCGCDCVTVRKAAGGYPSQVTVANHTALCCILCAGLALCRLCCTPAGAAQCTLPPCSPRPPCSSFWMLSRRQRLCCRAQDCHSLETQHFSSFVASLGNAAKQACGVRVWCVPGCRLLGQRKLEALSVL